MFFVTNAFLVNIWAFEGVKISDLPVVSASYLSIVVDSSSKLQVIEAFT
jgi:hypothetical protein